MNRHQRQIQFPGLGEKGQAKLAQASVVLVGCGGLGSTLAECMVRTGVARLTIIDPDVADITNLHRQFLFDEEDVRKKVLKAIAAAEKLKRADSRVDVVGIAARLSVSNADALLSGHDLVLDGTDNMETRHVINDWCVKNGIPWIYGAVAGASGMILVILPGKGPCLRCLYPDSETNDEITAETIGMVNTAPAFVALLQATEALKLLTGSPALIRKLRVIDLWTGDDDLVGVAKNPQCPCCGEKHSL